MEILKAISNKLCPGRSSQNKVAFISIENHCWSWGSADWCGSRFHEALWMRSLDPFKSVTTMSVCLGLITKANRRSLHALSQSLCWCTGFRHICSTRTLTAALWKAAQCVAAVARHVHADEMGMDWQQELAFVLSSSRERNMTPPYQHSSGKHTHPQHLLLTNVVQSCIKSCVTQEYWTLRKTHCCTAGIQLFIITTC